MKVESGDRGALLAVHVPPATVHSVLKKYYGDEYLGWEYETLYQEIESDFEVELSSALKNKIQAIRTYLATDRFESEAQVFEKICLAINEVPINIQSFDLLAVEEAAFACLTLGMIRKIKPTEYSRQVVGYVQTICRKEGFLKYPDPLAFAEPDENKSIPGYEKIQPKVDFEGLESDDIHRVQSAKLGSVMAYSAFMIGKGLSSN